MAVFPDHLLFLHYLPSSGNLLRKGMRLAVKDLSPRGQAGFSHHYCHIGVFPSRSPTGSLPNCRSSPISPSWKMTLGLTIFSRHGRRPVLLLIVTLARSLTSWAKGPFRTAIFLSDSRWSTRCPDANLSFHPSPPAVSVPNYSLI